MNQVVFGDKGISISSIRNDMLSVCLSLVETIESMEKCCSIPYSIVSTIKSKLNTIVLWKDDAQVEGTSIWEYLTWIISIYAWILKSIVKSALGMCYRACRIVFYVPGVSKSTEMVSKMVNVLQRAVDGKSESKTSEMNLGEYVNSLQDAPLTAVVLSYEERATEQLLPKSLSQRIHRMMHFRVSLYPFDATVRLPSDEEKQVWTMPKTYVAMTPRSIPASPSARDQVQKRFSQFSKDVLYRARDQLRREREETLSGIPQDELPTFCPDDAHEDIFLSCGYHCAYKMGGGLHRSCRSTRPILKNRYTYFQMSVKAKNNAVTEEENKDLGICIGLATEDMPLDTLVGMRKHSIGLHSAGCILRGSLPKNATWGKYAYGVNSTVGVLVYIDDTNVEHDSNMNENWATVRVIFFVNGRQVQPGECQITIPRLDEMYPTLTLFSDKVEVHSHFSMHDLKNNVYDDLEGFSDFSVWSIDNHRIDARTNDTNKTGL